jgi:hypothetical protein
LHSFVSAPRWIANRTAADKTAPFFLTQGCVVLFLLTRDTNMSFGNLKEISIKNFARRYPTSPRPASAPIGASHQTGGLQSIAQRRQEQE